MFAQIIPGHIEKESPPNTPLHWRLRWPFAVACCLYFLLAYLFLATATPTFAKLFEGLSVDLPLPTRLLMKSYSWLFPVFFVGAVILTIAKQIVPLDKSRLRIANLILIFVGVVFLPLVILDFYLPWLVLVYKLHSMR